MPSLEGGEPIIGQWSMGSIIALKSHRHFQHFGISNDLLPGSWCPYSVLSYTEVSEKLPAGLSIQHYDSFIFLLSIQSALGMGTRRLSRQPHQTSFVSLQVMDLDLSSLQSVRSFASAWGSRPLHLLINNAGIFAMAGMYRTSASQIMSPER